MTPFCALLSCALVVAAAQGAKNGPNLCSAGGVDFCGEDVPDHGVAFVQTALALQDIVRDASSTSRGAPSEGTTPPLQSAPEFAYDYPRRNDIDEETANLTVRVHAQARVVADASDRHDEAVKVSYGLTNGTNESEALQEKAQAKADTAGRRIEKKQPVAEEAAAHRDALRKESTEVAATLKRTKDEAPVVAANLSSMKKAQPGLEEANNTAAQKVADKSLEHDVSKAAKEYGKAHKQAVAANRSYADVRNRSENASAEYARLHHENVELVAQLKANVVRQKEAEKNAHDLKDDLEKSAKEKEAAVQQAVLKLGALMTAKQHLAWSEKARLNASEALDQNERAIAEATMHQRSLANDSVRGAAKLTWLPGELAAAEANASELNDTLNALEEKRATSQQEAERLKQEKTQAEDKAKSADMTLTKTSDELQAEIDELNRLNARLREAQDRHEHVVVKEVTVSSEVKSGSVKQLPSATLSFASCVSAFALASLLSN